MMDAVVIMHYDVILLKTSHRVRGFQEAKSLKSLKNVAALRKETTESVVLAPYHLSFGTFGKGGPRISYNWKLIRGLLCLPKFFDSRKKDYLKVRQFHN